MDEIWRANKYYANGLDAESPGESNWQPGDLCVNLGGGARVLSTWPAAAHARNVPPPAPPQVARHMVVRGAALLRQSKRAADARNPPPEGTGRKQIELRGQGKLFSLV